MLTSSPYPLRPNPLPPLLCLAGPLPLSLLPPSFFPPNPQAIEVRPLKERTKRNMKEIERLLTCPSLADPRGSQLPPPPSFYLALPTSLQHTLMHLTHVVPFLCSLSSLFSTLSSVLCPLPCPLSSVLCPMSAVLSLLLLSILLPRSVPEKGRVHAGNI